jgi:hypothetical protein
LTGLDFYQIGADCWRKLEAYQVRYLKLVRRQKKKADNYYEKSVEKVFGENSEATSKTIMKVRSQKP